ncbi:putative aminodeoxychorismate lyase [Actinoplanes missouriensis 431]|uniref:Endolytic murein transglycosylase n=1 Tax=Actinoplanes missouriensis (strain ATCC 14538 / DSM 43046 / CBS 188.64 / JCM 3121 / NBRC 102363 / NCIMB 12654 / NRRL B-3342 / UNCC 431) TaxID=512565 RepID=I0HEL3_ACTM4|nr:endolytic transglycosylase MltG [Actinoplanes missouriensis]BAL91450.1 putative aminodeoxychorismate lyase [Actinoplanes missouriensis 431]
MIDELDVAFEEDADRSKPRRHRARKGGGRSAVALLVTFVLLAGLGGGVYFGYTKVRGLFVAADYSGAGSAPVEVQVQKNASLTEIGNELVKADVVKSTKAFTNAAEAEPRSKNIQSGTYNLRKQMSAKDAVALLLDPAARVSKGVTIPEGKTAKQTFELLAKATGLPVKDFEAAAKDPEALGVPDWWFKRNDGKQVAKGAEGFLFPDTYEFDPKADAGQVLSTMVDHFLTVTGELGFADDVQKSLKVSPYEALIVASLSQAEAGIADDLPKVSRVAYNRAYKEDMTLQFDVTTNYWLELQGKDPKHSGELLAKEMEDPKNPYNTETVKGLPLGPINSPGKAALTGAMKPADGPWLFFVAVDKSGKSAFAVTSAEHDKNVQKACAAGINLCGK